MPDLSPDAADLMAALQTVDRVIDRWQSHPPRLGRELMPGEAEEIVLAAARGWQIIAAIIAEGGQNGQDQNAAAGVHPARA